MLIASDSYAASIGGTFSIQILYVYTERRKSVIKESGSSRYSLNPKIKNPPPNIAMATPMGSNLQLPKMQTGGRVSIEEKADK